MATINSTTTLDGDFQNVYADIDSVIPEQNLMQADVDFVPRDLQNGAYYVEGVILGNEHGATFAAPNSGGFPLKSSVAMTVGKAQIEGYQTLLRSQLDYESIARASSGGKGAFKAATELVVTSMKESVHKYVECDLFYGQSGLATTISSANAGATSTVVTCTAASWADGIWGGMEGQRLNFYNGASLISSNADAVFTITAINLDNYTITVSGTSTGITALDAATASGLTIYWDGQYGNSMAGLKKILTNTGTLFNISAANYNYWKGVEQTVGGQLTMQSVLAGFAKANSRGLAKKSILYVNPKAYKDLNAREAALRRYDSSYGSSKAKNGFGGIEYEVNGFSVTVKSHPIVKQGDAFAIDPSDVIRVGAAQPTFKLPLSGMSVGDSAAFFTPLTEYAAVELRCYTNQALFVRKPARAIYFSGIVNS